MSPEVITIGESMLRLATARGEALERARQLQVEVAGAESNVAVGLTRLGVRSGWISRLVDNPLGRRIAADLKAAGVDTSRVLWARQGRVGTYYLQPGSPPRPAQVIYDRAGSAFARIDPDAVDWDYVAGARLIHLTGITPALSPTCLKLVQQTLARAGNTNQTISFDVNFRGRLWSTTKARHALEPLLEQVDVLICSRRDAAAVFELDGTAQAIAQNLSHHYGPPQVVVTDGDQGACAWDGEFDYAQAGYRVEVVDRVGAGDAFAAGVIAGFLDGGMGQGLAFGNASAALKLTFLGDMPWSTRADVEALVQAKGGQPGIIR